jgi:hypothetical protein
MLCSDTLRLPENPVIEECLVNLRIPNIFETESESSVGIVMGHVYVWRGHGVRDWRGEGLKCVRAHQETHTQKN